MESISRRVLAIDEWTDEQKGRAIAKAFDLTDQNARVLASLPEGVFRESLQGLMAQPQGKFQEMLESHS